MEEDSTSRRTTRRRWIKLYPQQCIQGSISYQLDPAERGTWFLILCFAGICPKPGVIGDSDGRPYPHSFIANRINIPLELFEETLKKCVTEGRLHENDNGIHITNWNAYQSEYERQKHYRDIKKSDIDLEDHIKNVSGRSASDIAEMPVQVRKGILACLDKDDRGKAAEVRKLVGEHKKAVQ